MYFLSEQFQPTRAHIASRQCLDFPGSEGYNKTKSSSHQVRGREGLVGGGVNGRGSGLRADGRCGRVGPFNDACGGESWVLAFVFQIQGFQIPSEHLSAKHKSRSHKDSPHNHDSQIGLL